MRKLILRLLLVAAFFAPAVITPALAQSTSTTTAVTTWSCFPGVTLTDDIYWAHQPVAVQALRSFASTDPLLTQTALQLAQQGYAIDNAIMLWQWDPVCTMGIRAADGYTWVPSLLQTPVQVAPGINLPGIASYDPNNPPAGSIKVSTNAADYPAATPPPAPTPAPAPAPSLIGVCYNGGTLGTVCAPGPAATGLVNGQILTSNGKSYLVHSVQGMFGVTVWLTPQ